MKPPRYRLELYNLHSDDSKPLDAWDSENEQELIDFAKERQSTYTDNGQFMKIWDREVGKRRKI